MTAAPSGAARAHPITVMLRESREARGITQTEIAQALGTTQAAVSRLERTVNDPHISTLETYAARLGFALTLEWIDA